MNFQTERFKQIYYKKAESRSSDLQSHCKFEKNFLLFFRILVLCDKPWELAEKRKLDMMLIYRTFLFNHVVLHWDGFMGVFFQSKKTRVKCCDLFAKLFFIIWARTIFGHDIFWRFETFVMCNLRNLSTLVLLFESNITI